MKATQIMDKPDFLKFQDALEKGKAASFIKEYATKATATSLTDEDILGLALMQAVREKKTELVKKILFAYPRRNVLAVKNYKNYSPLTYALFFHHATGETSKKIQDFLEMKGTEIPKKELAGRDFVNMYNILHSALGLDDYMTTYDNMSYLKEHFLSYVYTPTSIQELEKTLDINFKANEYMKQFEKSKDNPQEPGAVRI